MAQAAKAPQVKGQTDHLGRRADPHEWNHLYPQLCTNEQAHIQLDPPQYMFID